MENVIPDIDLFYTCIIKASMAMFAAFLLCFLIKKDTALADAMVYFGMSGSGIKPEGFLAWANVLIASFCAIRFTYSGAGDIIIIIVIFTFFRPYIKATLSTRMTVVVV